MKKVITSLSAILLVVAICFAFVACDNAEVTPGNTDFVITSENCGVTVKENNIVVIKAKQEIFDMLDSNKQFLANYMELLKDANVLDYVAKEGSYGLFIETVNGVTANAASEYWRICTNDADYSSPAGEWNTPVEIDGITYLSAALGVSSLPVKVGATYVLKLESY